MSQIQIMRAGREHVGIVAPLFDAYRQFYQRPADPDLARRFIAARLDNDESVIFLAVDASGAALGFAQLYPTFCSVAAKRAWTLYDLFVTPPARRQGIARALMARARQLGEETGAAWIRLDTALANKEAQPLYESLGYVRDTEFYSYFLPL